MKKYTTTWDFSRNTIVINSEIARAIKYNYDLIETANVIANSIEKFVGYNNQYGYVQVTEEMTLKEIRKWLPCHINDLLKELSIEDNKGNFIGKGSNYYRPSKEFIEKRAEAFYGIYHKVA